MKTWPVFILIGILLAAFAPAMAADNAKAVVPKYDPATEAKFKGTVEEVTDRVCPVSGGMGSHVVLKMADGTTIEVHIATTKFLKNYDVTFNKGDEVEVTGVKVTFQGAETIFAREIKHGQDVFVFRDKDGKPVW
jgi:DNA/RNA endonuclease YhcR with UshA esterase domain